MLQSMGLQRLRQDLAAEKQQCGIFPGPGRESVSPALAGELLTTGPPRKSGVFLLNSDVFLLNSDVQLVASFLEHLNSWLEGCEFKPP